MALLGEAQIVVAGWINEAAREAEGDELSLPEELLIRRYRGDEAEATIELERPEPELCQELILAGKVGQIDGLVLVLLLRLVVPEIPLAHDVENGLPLDHHGTGGRGRAAASTPTAGEADDKPPEERAEPSTPQYAVMSVHVQDLSSE